MTRHRTTRTLTSLAILASSLAIGISASPSPVSAAAVTLPTPQYRLSVNAPSTAATPLKYSGRGSWTDVELLNGQLAVPLFKVGSDQKVPARTSVIVSNLGTATSVRAALDSVVQSEADGVFGKGANEQAALSLYVLPSGDDPNIAANWDAAGTFEAHGDQAGSYYKSVGMAGFDMVMFVVDLYCRTSISAYTGSGSGPVCDSVSGLVPGGTNLMIEVEGSGDGEFNTGFTGSAININPQTKGVGNVVTMVTADGGDAGADPDPHGLLSGDVITGVAGCSGRSFEVTKIDDTSFSVVADCAPDGPIGANVNKVARGDEAYEVVFGTDSVSVFDEQDPTDPNDGVFENSLTDDAAEFIDRGASEPRPFRSWTGLLSVPECGDVNDAGPCLEGAPTGSTGYGTGWSVMLLDDPIQNRFTIRPWRNAHPYYVTSGVSVSMSLRIPSGDFRDWANYEFDDGLSSAFSNAQINSFSYTAEDDYHTVEVDVTAREMSRVTRFDVTSSGSGSEFFTDYCTGRLSVSEDGIVYIDTNGDFDYDAGEEDVLDCQNEAFGISVDRVSLWGDSSGSNDRAWLRAPGHSLGVGDDVTVCCAYGAFDGAQEIVEVGNPYGASDTSGGANDWFAFDTSSGSFDDKSFPRAEGLNDPGWEVIDAQVVNRDFIRVTSTAVTLDVSLSQVGPACPENICGVEIPSNQHLAGGFISTNAQAFAFGQGMDSATPSFDFGVAGPSFNAAGEARTTDGFFRACIPARFLSSKFGGIAAATAATQINGTTASSTANRNGALVAATATCGEPGGVLASLNQFGFSAPYFAIRPRVASLGGAPASSPEVTTPAVTAPRVTVPVVVAPTTVAVRTIPSNRIPGRGRVVTIPKAPSTRVADAVGMKVSSNGVTFALNPTARSVRSGQTYVVTLIGPDGKRQTLRFRPRNDRQNVNAAFRSLPPGDYRMVVQVRNRNGRIAGRWTSPSFGVRG